VKPPARLPQDLALQVPQREVDRRHRVAGIARLAARREQPVQAIPDLLVAQRVHPHQRVRRNVVDGAGDHLLLGDARHPGAHTPVVELDVDEAQRQRGRLALA
jgi:hypothetical protein